MTTMPAQWQRQAAPTDDTVTASAVMAAAGISYRQLDVWVTAGRLHPIGPANPGNYGPHSRRRFPASEVRIARLIKRLLDAGLDVQHAHDAARALDDGTVRLGAGLVLLVEEP